ncbi:hypothetical protein [Novosphingobium mangrovi (ex Hu et al. 2023)]|uniref:Peptidase S54 rhomboid domain-containing protein n=1 Tax=Novosphingobium mangrovi (ex Hu et al. 2023) TaxID=2930094 RepID=A0ABT0A7G0_9SPHN|nr:hypothetical protein [Novosphingobium mangrovi (ex Hu et al. 2023)]MCJ1959134.1 hypothetical protein [Novosphingobium mangrovi (ex Hu et al. 2023)]
MPEEVVEFYTGKQYIPESLSDSEVKLTFVVEREGGQAGGGGDGPITPSFYAWVKRRWKLLFPMSIFTWSVYLIRSDYIDQILQKLGLEGREGASRALIDLFGPQGIGAYLVQVSILFIMICVASRPPSATGIPKRVRTAINSFHKYWNYLMYSWLALYIGLITTTIIRINYEDIDRFIDIINVTEDLLNNFCSYFLFILYYNFAENTVVKSGNGDEYVNHLKQGPAMAALFCFFAAELIFSLMIGYSDNFAHLSGFVAGVLTCAFVSKLDSPFVRLPKSVFIFLMGYGCIQMAWEFVSEQLGGGQQARLNLFVIYAILSKGALFLVIEWLFRTGLIAWQLHAGATVGEESSGDAEKYLYGRIV